MANYELTADEILKRFPQIYKAIRDKLQLVDRIPNTPIIAINNQLFYIVESKDIIEFTDTITLKIKMYHQFKTGHGFIFTKNGQEFMAYCKHFINVGNGCQFSISKHKLYSVNLINKMESKMDEPDINNDLTLLQQVNDFINIPLNSPITSIKGKINDLTVHKEKTEGEVLYTLQFQNHEISLSELKLLAICNGGQ